MIVLDMHVLVWWVDGDAKKLSRKARQALEQHGKRNELLIASSSVFEIRPCSAGRLRFSLSAAEWLARVRRLAEFHVEPLSDEIAGRAGQFGDAFPGDPADRMIAATALCLGVPLVSHDEKLRGTARFALPAQRSP